MRFHEEELDQPSRWRRPRRIFVNSMSDTFHESVTDEQICKIFQAMRCSRHVFQVLTKRAWRMHNILSRAKNWEGWMTLDGEPPRGYGGNAPILGNINNWPLPNVWLGVSAEDQITADERIPLLLDTPAAVRWISAEPLLGPIELRQPWVPLIFGRIEMEKGIDWLVAGGESGPDARPMHPEWARSLRDQCIAAKIPFFFKQWGEWLPIATPRMKAKIGDTLLLHKDGSTQPATWNDVMESRGDVWAVQKVGKHNAGSHLDGEEWKQYPR